MATLPLSRARTIIRKTLEAGRERDLQPLAVVVLDAGGHVVAFERSDGASAGRFAIAHGKAYGAVMMGLPGSDLQARAAANPAFMGALNGAFGGAIVPVPGGILVRDARGRLLGAVGVTGDTSDNDAQAGQAGIEAARLVAEI